LNSKYKTSRFLTATHADGILAAAGHAFCINRPLNISVTIHLKQAGITTTHAFVTSFFKLLGDWLRTHTAEPPYYVWVLENEPGKGLHLHALVHIPMVRQARFRELARNWLQALGNNPQPNSMFLRCVYHARLFSRSASPSSAWKYLGHWGQQHDRDGLKGALGYMLKGMNAQHCRTLNIGHDSQGVVAGKRCGFSEALGPLRRTEALSSWRRCRSSFPYSNAHNTELWRYRMLLHTGFRRETNYVPTN
jgi:hypothetical protein